MRLEASIAVAAPPEQVFDVYADVERWPEWTTSVSHVERLDQGAFGVGSRARVRQPRLPVAVWEVTEFVPGRTFTWVARGPGILTTGRHVVVASDEADHAEVTASVDQAGPLAPVVGLLTTRLTHRYLQTEVRGLKALFEM